MPRVWIRLLVSLLLTVGLCFFLLRQVDIAALGQWLRQVNRPLAAGYVALAIAGLLARAFRYRMLLGDRVAFGPLVLVTAARNFLVDLLPARVGSLSYIYLLTSRFGVELEPVLSSFLVTFVYDLLAMALLVAVALALEFGRFESWGTVAVLLGIFASVAVAVFTLLSPGLRLGARWLDRSPRTARFARRLEEVAREVERSGGVRQILQLLLVSFAIRGFKFAAYWSLLLGVVYERGITASDLPFWQVFLGIAGAELSATLPIHGIAGFGTYEAAWALGFTHLGLDRETAILSGFATHLLSQAFDYSTGLLALLLVLALRRKP